MSFKPTRLSCLTILPTAAISARRPRRWTKCWLALEVKDLDALIDQTVPKAIRQAKNRWISASRIPSAS